MAPLLAIVQLRLSRAENSALQPAAIIDILKDAI